MTEKCQWVESQLEAYFSETMDSDTRTNLDQHVADCFRCQSELDGYAKVDALVAAHFSRQVARAESSRGRRVQPLRLAVAVATVAVALGVAWIGVSAINPSMDNRVPTGSLIQSTTALDAADDVEKAEDTLDAERAKPEPAPEVGTPPPPDRPPDIQGPATAGTRFYVQDRAGYFHTLEDFRGSVLVLAVVDDDPEATIAFSEAYESYRSEQDLRFLGVAPEGTTPDGLGFPTMINLDSALLETQAGEFAIVAPDGTIYARGALETGELSAAIAASLERFGSR